MAFYKQKPWSAAVPEAAARRVARLEQSKGLPAKVYVILELVKNLTPQDQQTLRSKLDTLLPKP